jgi:hypothetical protein
MDRETVSFRLRRRALSPRLSAPRAGRPRLRAGRAARTGFLASEGRWHDELQEIDAWLAVNGEGRERKLAGR